ncbi:hypothetical protein [Pseudoxanthomonas wuyuanensis]|uniref:Uncharacterized protein n=1 Tax=Pseudoxanthomonas wuyuanensis TaxID=1073196 RepID=A0A286DAG9_9GAMM|nr:hypothetical protein [Pseudoxanthomonas wuyuanensis]KAF1720570.1 hypothetical protein CSC75_10935 [Pseudoxanthomonas wuyuanensis]SOD55638.1 hypothetical protein SAMN06296416_107225 [Pseudoxanthomonas wuyuanensis]
MKLRRYAWGLCASLAIASAAQAAASPACVESVLRRLGWRIETAALPAVRIDAGTPCARADLAQAQSADDLWLRLPATIEAGDREAALQAALQHPATLCAYLFVLGDATRRATAALAANEGYRFNALQLGWIGFGPRGAMAQGWRPFRSFGRGYAPAAGNTRALDAFYRGRVRSECGVGRQVAQLATQRELYGDAGFDAEFSAGELSIGTFLSLHGTDSILLGRGAGQLLADGNAVRAARLGRHGLVGLPGAIVHAYDRILLDDVHNQAENFVVAEVSADAAEALRRAGGLAHYDRVNLQVWQLARQLRQRGPRDFQQLLYHRDAAQRARLDLRDRAIVVRIDALLADPFYRGFRIYVHRQGVQPIAYHLVRLLDRNPRTPYTVELTLHNLHTTLYRRWIDHQLRACAAGR